MYIIRRILRQLDWIRLEVFGGNRFKSVLWAELWFTARNWATLAVVLLSSESSVVWWLVLKMKSRAWEIICYGNVATFYPRMFIPPSATACHYLMVNHFLKLDTKHKYVLQRTTIKLKSVSYKRKIIPFKYFRFSCLIVRITTMKFNNSSSLGFCN